ncbi:MAG: VOC family protein [Bacteroidetes bacterium]|nr:VOC family protein [Bacteroidota bacterium]
MKTQINPYLIFNGNCSEAMNFYKKCFGGDLILQTVGESPMAGQWPESSKDRILHASLVNKDLCLLASDMGTDKVVMGNVISLALGCSSKNEIEVFFERLSQGGKITHPLHEFFDGTIGALTDKYGMNWVLKF